MYIGDKFIILASILMAGLFLICLGPPSTTVDDVFCFRIFRNLHYNSIDRPTMDMIGIGITVFLGKLVLVFFPYIKICIGKKCVYISMDCIDSVFNLSICSVLQSFVHVVILYVSCNLIHV